jgi:RNA polymerase sigma factor (sigma-70 family)
MTLLPVWEHWDAMIAASRKVLGSLDDAHDCAAEAMTQVLERQPDGVENLEAFMVTVAKRRAIDRYRAQQRGRRRERMLAAQVALTAPDFAEDVATRAEARWADETARAVLKPNVYRLVRMLADGVPLSDAAARLGMSDRAAESHLLRARRAVRGALGKTFGVLAAAFACGRRVGPAAAPAVVAVAASTALLVGGPAPGPRLPASDPPAKPILGDAAPTAVVAELVLPTGAATPPRGVSARAPLSLPAASVGVAQASPRSTTSAVVSTPVAGVDSYDTDDGQQSEGTAEQVLQCVQNLKVTIGYQGCEKDPSRPG